MTELPYDSRRYYLLSVSAECWAALTKPDTPHCANGFGRKSAIGRVLALSWCEEMQPKDKISHGRADQALSLGWQLV